MTGQAGRPDRHTVVVGASLAGTRCVQSLRSNGFTGQVTLIGAEPHLPYDRPPLSKAGLAQEWSAGSIASILLAEAPEWDALDVDLRLGRPAAGIDPVARRVLLADGPPIDYDVLVLATGAMARPSPWQPRSGLHLLRTIDDAQAVCARLALGEPVVVIGGGLIGTEVAAAARSRGCPVTLIDPVPEPMARLVGPEIAGSLVRLHHRHGTTTRFGVGVASVQGEQGALRILLDDGTSVSAATAVIGIGAVPATDWLTGSGLDISDGVRCDEYLRALGATGVYAIGDVARWPHPGLRREVRSEHWTNAADQARYVGAAIAHGVTAHGATADVPVAPYRPSDYVWSDQYDWKVQSVGWRDPHGAATVVGDLDTAGRAAVVHADADGRVCGAVTVNWPRALLQCRKMLAEPEPMTAVLEVIEGLAGFGVPAR